MFYICVHACNDAKTVGLLVWKIRQVFGENPREYRLLITNDGSTDDTAEVLGRYQGALAADITVNPEPIGYAACMDRMLRSALKASDRPRRDCVITLAADYAISPAVIPEFVRRFESGADVVVGEAINLDTSIFGRMVRKTAHVLLKPGVEVPGIVDLLSGAYAVRLVTLKRAMQHRNGLFLETRGACAAAELLARVSAEARQIAVVEIPTSQIRPGARRMPGAFSLALDLFRAGRTLNIPVPEVMPQRGS